MLTIKANTHIVQYKKLAAIIKYTIPHSNKSYPVFFNDPLCPKETHKRIHTRAVVFDEELIFFRKAKKKTLVRLGECVGGSTILLYANKDGTISLEMVNAM